MIDADLAVEALEGIRDAVPRTFGPPKAHAHPQWCLIVEVETFPARRTAVAFAFVTFRLPIQGEDLSWSWEIDRVRKLDHDRPYPDGLDSIEVCPASLLSQLETPEG